MGCRIRGHLSVMLPVFCGLLAGCSRTDLAPVETGSLDKIIPLNSSREVEIDPRPAGESSVVMPASISTSVAASAGEQNSQILGAQKSKSDDDIEVLKGISADDLDEQEQVNNEEPSAWKTTPVNAQQTSFNQRSAQKYSQNIQADIRPSQKIQKTAETVPKISAEQKIPRKISEKKVSEKVSGKGSENRDKKIEKPADRKNIQTAEKPKMTDNRSTVSPLKGKIISRFGELDENGDANEGINVEGRLGQPVVSLKAGKVVYVGNDKLPEYGNMVIIRHDNDLVSTYAHLDSVNVHSSQAVNAGSKIGSVGKTGEDVATPQLYFQLMKNNKPIDPSKYF